MDGSGVCWYVPNGHRSKSFFYAPNETARIRLRTRLTSRVPVRIIWHQTAKRWYGGIEIERRYETMQVLGRRRLFSMEWLNYSIGLVWTDVERDRDRSQWNARYSKWVISFTLTNAVFANTVIQSHANVCEIFSVYKLRTILSIENVKTFDYRVAFTTFLYFLFHSADLLRFSCWNLAKFNLRNVRKQYLTPAKWRLLFQGTQVLWGHSGWGQTN